VYPSEYIIVMYTIVKSDTFDDWLKSLRDVRAKAKIIVRIKRAEAGNFGDCAPVGEGVSEMRIHFGPGYRVYFVQRGALVFLLLLGGDKSTQEGDIEKAKALARLL